MTNRYIASLIALTALTAGAQQSLTKEIVVDREVEPHERAANRPASITPSIIVPKMQMMRLQPGEYTGTGTLRRTIPCLEAAAYADSFAVSPYRGYATVGYLPTFNMGISAGYSIINKKNQQLGAWMQYNGESYKMDSRHLLAASPADDKVTLKQHVFNLGVDNTTHFNRLGTLTASAQYMMGTVSQPNIAHDYDQTVTGADLRADWQSQQTNKLRWHAGAHVGSFGYDKKAPESVLYNMETAVGDPALKAVGELRFGGRLGIAAVTGRHSWGVDADLSFQHLNQMGGYAAARIGETDEAQTRFTLLNGGTFGIITVSPYYNLSRGSFKMRLGVDIAFQTTGGQTGDDIYPNIHLSFAPTGAFALWANAVGGTVLNSLRDLWQLSSRQLSCLTYTPSRYVDYVGGITVGPAYGVSIEGWIGYSIAKEWLTPAVVRDVDCFVARELKGVYYGARASWQLRKWVELSASVEGAPNKDTDKGYYRWRDNARWQYSVNLTVRPADKLSIQADWTLRTGRSALLMQPKTIFGMIGYWDATRIGLGNSNQLNIGATYAVTPVLTAFADIENVLAKRWFTTPQIQSAPVHGLVGLSLKF